LSRSVRMALAAGLALAGLLSWTGLASAGTVAPAARNNPVSAQAGLWPNQYLGGVIRNKTDWSDVIFTLKDYDGDGQVCLYIGYTDGQRISSIDCLSKNQTHNWGTLGPQQFRLYAASGGASHFPGTLFY
jgi:hypothetical protein